MRILVVEDEEKVSSFIRKGLEQMAYTVETAGTGEEALALALSTRYDAIVLDVMLPGRDGLSVVRELRARGSDAPVLALTARGTLEDRIEIQWPSGAVQSLGPVEGNRWLRITEGRSGSVAAAR